MLLYGSTGDFVYCAPPYQRTGLHRNMTSKKVAAAFHQLPTVCPLTWLDLLLYTHHLSVLPWCILDRVAEDT